MRARGPRTRGGLRSGSLRYSWIVSFVEGRSGTARPRVAAGPFIEAGLPVLHLPLGLVLADAVGLLDLARQLVPLSADGVDIVVGELAPLLLDLALELLPVAFDAIPIHVLSSF